MTASDFLVTLSHSSVRGRKNLAILMGAGMSESLIPLADMIAALRDELDRAVEVGRARGPRFQVGPIELELTLVVGREATPEGKISFKVFGSGAEVSVGGKISDERTHRIKLTLTPVDQAGEPTKILVSDDEP